MLDSIHRMTGCIRHRGPDADGFHVDEDVGLALGHRRLAIVDLSPTGAQPMSSRDGRFVMVFNGEIYNFRALRESLKSRGVQFRGSSDTEVMLESFALDGVRESIEKFAGMFAFSVWDRRERVLWLARDRMGEKPLYFGQFGKTFAWASELKSLRQLENCPREIDPLAVADVLERGYVRGERCILKGVQKLPPGALLQVRKEGHSYETCLEKYWSVDEVLRKRDSGAEHREVGASVDDLDSLLRSVIGDEMLADVPVGAFLSGGIDSSLVVAIMQQVASQPVRTFTIGFDNSEYDESLFAREVAAHLGTNHTEIQLSARDALRFLDKLPTVFDEPFADPSELPTLLVCEATREFVTVALSGDGGDELFGGYSQYLNRDSLGTAISKVPEFARRSLATGVGVIPDTAFKILLSRDTWPQNAKARIAATLSSPTPRESHETLLSAWANPASVMAARFGNLLSDSRLAIAWPSAPTFAEAQMAYDMQTYLPDDILVKVDRSAMSVSLETRAPLLDHRIVEFALASPANLKIRGSTGKQLLRTLLDRYLPRAMWERPKRGFTVPLAEWLRTDLADWSRSMLQDDELFREWIRPAAVRRIWAEHMQGKDHGTRLWRILILMQWFRSNQ